eukprot:1631111-Pyramimonas_sp.AAC.1
MSAIASALVCCSGATIPGADAAQVPSSTFCSNPHANAAEVPPPTLAREKLARRGTRGSPAITSHNAAPCCQLRAWRRR